MRNPFVTRKKMQRWLHVQQREWFNCEANALLIDELEKRTDLPRREIVKIVLSKDQDRFEELLRLAGANLPERS
jgi:hypothetical protein